MFLKTSIRFVLGVEGSRWTESGAFLKTTIQAQLGRIERLPATMGLRSKILSVKFHCGRAWKTFDWCCAIGGIPYLLLFVFCSYKVTLVLTIFIHALILCIRRGIPPFLSSLSFASSSLSLHAIIVVTDNHFHEVLGRLGDG